MEEKVNIDIHCCDNMELMSKIANNSKELSRNFIGCDINPKSCEIGKGRIK